jgi:cytochrome c-type biogenesis protein CcmH
MLRKRRVFVAAAALAGALSIFGCDKKQAPSAASGPSGGIPPLDEKTMAAPIGDKPVHAPSAEAQDPHGGMNLPPGHPQIGGGAAAPSGMAGGGGDTATPGDIPFDAKSVVQGTLQLDAKLKGKVADGDVIYLVARSADQPGPPLAVKRMTATKFPMAFELDGRDAMMAGTKMSGKVTITARVDKDGDAMTKNPGDITGTKTVEVPANKVVLNLDTVL